MTLLVQWATFPPVSWVTLPGLLLLAVDAALVAFLGRTLAGMLDRERRHPVVRAMTVLTLAAFVIIASGWILGGVGALGRWGFVLLHGGLACLLLLCRGRAAPSRAGPGLPQVLFLGGDRRGRARTGPFLRLLLPATGWVTVGLLLYALALAVGSFPGTADSQTYHLTRVGYWLQEHRLSMDFANDTRLTFMPVNTELFMLWLAGFFPVGYPLVNLAQYFGGVLCVLSVFELGRLAGLPRPSRLLAAALLLGMPSVLLHFSTSQSDLFTAGLLNAGLAFLWRCFRTRSRAWPVLAGLAIGLAFGAKGSPLYWVPGLSIWVGFLLWRHRTDLRRLLPALAAIALLAIIAGGWKYADNWARYGNPFAPREDIAWMRQRGTSSRLSRAGFIGAIHAWQLLQPNSNPRFLEPVLSPSKEALGRLLVASGLDSQFAGVDGWNFHDIQGIYRANPVYEDIVSFGLIAGLAGAAGLLADLVRARRGRPCGAGRRLAMGAALACFFAFFFTQQNPNAWDYRLFVLVAPFLAVVGAACLPVRRPWRASSLAAALLIGVQLLGGFDIQSRNILGGWRALCDPRDEGSLPFYEALEGQCIGLPPAVRTVAVSLTSNNWLAPYFRIPGGRRFKVVPLGLLNAADDSPAAFLRRSHFDALITNPGIFPARAWPGIETRVIRVGGPFDRVCYLLQKSSGCP